MRAASIIPIIEDRRGLTKDIILRGRNSTIRINNGNTQCNLTIITATNIIGIIAPVLIISVDLRGNDNLL